MKRKCFMLMGLIIYVFLGLSAVSASEISYTDTTPLDDSSIQEISLFNVESLEDIVSDDVQNVESLEDIVSDDVQNVESLEDIPIKLL